ncbi:MAG: aminoacyl-histidine dipeptidase [Acidobacteriota bacterium]|nr:MAG: aminoacyl-histidine dipeptidase [Acidobacteriota bacterium]
MTFVADFEPKSLWRHFDHILTIPRGSKKEQAMREYVIQVTKRSGLDYQVDDTGNVVVRKPPSSGREQVAVTILQGHMDMVNEKNSDVDHDFDKDPIKPRRDGEYLKATGTTLGSDNGIGIATMLAIMEAKDLEHGPLELLFTVDEETGMTGASGLAGNMLEGRRLINTDSEEEGVLTIGCAGGVDSRLYLSIAGIEAPPASKALSIAVRGLRGGHSGVDIHLQRGNAIKLLVRALFAVSLEHRFLLAEIKGGSAHNAIPREASAKVVVPANESAAIRSSIEKELRAAQNEWRTVDPKLDYQVQHSGVPQQVWDEATTGRALGLINALPHGVIMMSNDIEGLVETSTNVALVGVEDEQLSVLISSRSSVMTALGALCQRIRAAAQLAGARVEQGDGYPSWQPNIDSELLGVFQRTHEKVLGSNPRIGAIHAGLECSIIAEKYPGMDMISFGPQIEFPHSPDERVKVESVEKFYRVLTAVLEELP